MALKPCAQSHRAFEIVFGPFNLQARRLDTTPSLAAGRFGAQTLPFQFCERAQPDEFAFEQRAGPEEPQARRRLTLGKKREHRP